MGNMICGTAGAAPDGGDVALSESAQVLGLDSRLRGVPSDRAPGCKP